MKTGCKKQLNLVDVGQQSILVDRTATCFENLVQSDEGCGRKV